MKQKQTRSSRRQFDVLLASRSAQAAKMTLRPGASSDESPSNEHPHCEQWLFVVSGAGEAVVGKRRGSLRHMELAPQSLLLIEKGELHQIKNTGKQDLVTLNLYVPPAYDSAANPRER